ncbi:MAG: 23S rRNA (pseudouridine(1915)-N(3))-methyltransferase RlmH [Candidatus Aminicenantes bacterium]|nr:23S rRNA (pseudouridine(1915)-N(3))-methyltransferase RlmH [Candidatus Aminicenantes bacterium]
MIRLKILWPGKTSDPELKNLQDRYLRKINLKAKCELIETKEAKGITEKYSEKILEIEAVNLEKHIKDDFVVCLTDAGKELRSNEFARFLDKTSARTGKIITIVVGGFLGLGNQMLSKADYLLSLSKMTYSHELCRVMLLEQIYRAISILQRSQYAK